MWLIFRKIILICTITTECFNNNAVNSYNFFQHTFSKPCRRFKYLNINDKLARPSCVPHRRLQLGSMQRKYRQSSTWNWSTEGPHAWRICWTVRSRTDQWHRTKAKYSLSGKTSYTVVNTLRPKQNGCHFADNIFRCIFMNENISSNHPKPTSNGFDTWWNLTGECHMDQCIAARAGTHVNIQDKSILFAFLILIH